MSKATIIANPNDELNDVRREGYRDNLNEDEVIQLPEDRIQTIGDATVLDHVIPDARHKGQVIDLTGGAPTGAGGGTSQPKSSQSAPKADTGNPNAGQSQTQGQPKPKSTFNPEFDEMPEEDKNDSADHVADLVLHGFGELNKQLPKLFLLSEKKMKVLHKEGQINIYRRLPLHNGTGQTISTIDYVLNHNNETIKKFELPDSFKDQVKPLLSAVLKKKGAAVTPEQALIGLVGFHLVSTGLALWDVRAGTKELVEELKEMNKASQQQQPQNAFVSPDVPPVPTSATAEPVQEKSPVMVVVKDSIKNSGKKNTPKSTTLKITPDSNKPSKKRGRPFKNLIEENTK